MAWENSIFVISALIAGGIASLLGLVALQRRFVPGTVQFCLLMLACALWAGAYALELGSHSLSLKLFWVTVQYFGIAFVPPAWLAFILSYAGKEKWLTHRRVLWMILPPIALILLALTNSAHHLVWDQTELITIGSFTFLKINHTIGFYAFVLYSDVLLLAGTILVLRQAFQASRYYRWQAILVVVGTLISWLGNILYVGTLNPIPGLDWTPFGFAISGLAFGMALFRYRLLDIVPMARDAILEGIRDCVVVLDNHNRILDSNPAAEQLLKIQAGQAFGKPIDKYMPELVSEQGWLSKALQGEFEVVLERDGNPMTFEVNASYLTSDQADTIGHLVLFRDITNARHAERSLLESEERFRRLVEASLEGIFLLENWLIRDLNPQMAMMLGYDGSQDELIGRDVQELIDPADLPQIQKSIVDKIEGPFRLQMIRRDGTWIPVEARGKTVHLHDRKLWVAAIQDLSAQVHYQESLQRRDDILNAVSFVASSLLKGPDWETVIRDILFRLGQSAQASRAYLFAVDHPGCDGELRFSQRYEWVNTGVSPQIDNPDLQGFSFTEGGFLDWETRLLEGKPISGLVKDFPDAMAEFLSEEDIQALAIVPIFASRQLWGFLGFDECTTERLWSEGEIEALEAAANTIGAAIQRQEIECALRSSELRYRTMVDAARDVIFTLTPDGRISSLNPAFEEVSGWSVREWLGKSFLRLIDPSDFAIAQKVVHQVREGESLPVFDAQVRTRTGSPVVMEFKAVAERKNGEIQEIRGVAHDITARVHTERSLVQRMEELAALYETSLEISAQRDLSSLLQAIIDRACRLTRASRGGIYLISTSSQQLSLVVSHNLSEQFLGMTLKPGEGIAGKVLMTGKPLVSPDFSLWKGGTDKFDAIQFRRVMGIPLKIGKRVIGVITIGDDREVGSFSRDETQLISLFADQAAIAIENVRLIETEHQRVEELDALRAMIAEISLELDLNSLLNTALERAVKLTGATGGELALYIQEDHEIEVVASYNLGKTTTGTRLPVGEGAMGQAVERCEPITILDYATWNERSAKYEGIPIYAALAIPLMIGGRMVGVIGVFHSDQFYSFNKSELNLLTLFGQQAAIAVENARLFSETRRLAQIDSLTGLYNRRHFYDLARREFERARRYRQPLSAIMIDVDIFKQVNDRFGHAAGDAVLQSIAQSCLNLLRSVDLVARYGGEEFVALIPNTDLEGCRQSAERMRACVASQPFPMVDDGLSVTISLGIAEISKDCPNIDTLLDRADKALYIAKQSGKNQVIAWRGD